MLTWINSLYEFTSDFEKQMSYEMNICKKGLQKF